MGVSAEARFGGCPRVFMRLDAVCEEPSHWETGPNETVSAGIKGGNRRASSVWNTSAFRLPYALLVALNDPSKSPSTPATCAKSPARPCVFVLTKGMSAVGPWPTADIQLLVFARHPHRCSDRLGVPERARLYSASIQSSSLSSSVSTSWEISCGGDGSVSGRGASLSIGAIRHLLDQMRCGWLRSLFAAIGHRRQSLATFCRT